NMELEADHVIDALRKHRPRVLCCRPGYSGIDLEMERVVRAAREVDTTVFLDICRPYAKPWDYIAPALPHVDIFHSNEGEAMGVTRTTTVDDALDALLDAGVGAVFITDGGSGARVRTRRWDLIQPGLAVDAIDPTGAGDAFCAGVVRTLLDKDELDCDALGQDGLARLLVYAQAMGAAAASAVGTTTGVTVERVCSLVEAQGERLVTETHASE
ncbi:MAG: PfkB family carbohydrate kinase, partial [Methanopyri archaeon]|nr:PfkB family carbohydrate kinase [Methanopyri archaeon]